MGKPVAATFQHRQVQETAHWTKQRQAPVLYEPVVTPLSMLSRAVFRVTTLSHT